MRGLSDAQLTRFLSQLDPKLIITFSLSNAVAKEHDDFIVTLLRSQRKGVDLELKQNRFTPGRMDITMFGPLSLLRSVLMSLNTLQNLGEHDAVQDLV